MGQKKSRPKSSQLQNNFLEDDQLSEWGTDFDESFCGPGKICADEWTPLNSEPSSPVFTRRFHGGFESDRVITEQPYPTTFTLSDISENNNQLDILSARRKSSLPEVETVIIHDQEKRPMKKIRKRKKIRKKLKNTVRPEAVKSKAHYSTRSFHNKTAQKYEKRFHRSFRKREDSRYPTIPPPPNVLAREDLKFIRKRRDEVVHSKVVPPNRWRGRSIKAPEPFRYRGIKHHYHQSNN